LKHGFRESRRHIIVKVSGSISNNKSFKIDFLIFLVFGLGHNVVQVDLPSQIWNINTSITFTGDKELVASEFWELCVPGIEGGHSILR